VPDIRDTLHPVLASREAIQEVPGLIRKLAPENGTKKEEEVVQESSIIVF
jgi:hypothetical protein